jgi:hypothetical protein
MITCPPVKCKSINDEKGDKGAVLSSPSVYIGGVREKINGSPVLK